ncbi:hypothetical protein CYMTET_53648 [Cymbomonas tetramitiformis]|uniref:Uncharacterized protein n=1 Tax=Cymbomonas tetramitiformis TaxID=36881 RepID=A0AAE0BHX8_9CHLO|nr:hypothetical protein CYMTET_53648 [Cymbomonas tetramitiformis]
MQAAPLEPWLRWGCLLGDDKADRDGILEKLLSRLDNIEAFIKTQRMGGVPDSCRQRQGCFRGGGGRAVVQYGAPAVVRVGAAPGGVDIFAYGFAVVESDESEDDEIDVQEELRQLRAIQQVVPRHGGAAATGSDMRAGHIAHFSVPTEEFPGGVHLVPVRHAVTRTTPFVTLGAPISAVRFSLDAAEE